MTILLDERNLTWQQMKSRPGCGEVHETEFRKPSRTARRPCTCSLRHRVRALPAHLPHWSGVLSVDEQGLFRRGGGPEFDRDPQNGSRGFSRYPGAPTQSEPLASKGASINGARWLCRFCMLASSCVQQLCMVWYGAPPSPTPEALSLLWTCSQTSQLGAQTITADG